MTCATAGAATGAFVNGLAAHSVRSQPVSGGFQGPLASGPSGGFENGTAGLPPPPGPDSAIPGASDSPGAPVNPPAPDNLDAAAIAASVDPAVANITSDIPGGRAAGTGMVIASSGVVLTNNHVIAGATNIRVQTGGRGSVHSAHVVGADPANDVAVLQVDRASGLRTVALGDSGRVSVGDTVVAIGNALGRGGAPSVTQGAVTALDRTITAADAAGSTERLSGLLQVDAPIQPGDSGGPLVDSTGRVIGMVTAADAGVRRLAASRVAFAVPINTARAIAEQIQAGRGGGALQIGPVALIGPAVADRASLGVRWPGALEIALGPAAPRSRWAWAG